MARILIAEDDLNTLQGLQTIIEREGHEVETVSDGESGIRAAEEESPDVAIIDLIMPGKEGIETIIDIRNRFPEIRIVAISGGGQLGPGDYLRSAQLLGAHKTLAKPFKREEIVGAVEELLTKKA